MNCPGRNSYVGVRLSTASTTGLKESTIFRWFDVLRLQKSGKISLRNRRTSWNPDRELAS